VPVSFRPDRGKWELTVYHRGKRTRTLHESPEDALKAWRDHRRKIDRHGTQGESISREEGLEFIEAKRIVDGHDLRDVAAFWKNHHPDGSQTITVDAALREFLSLQKSRSLSGRHSSALDLHCGRFATDFSGRQIRSVSRKEVLDWL